MAVELNNCKLKIFEYVESRMAFIAPNLSVIVGASTAAKIMGKKKIFFFLIFKSFLTNTDANFVFRCCWWIDETFQDASLQRPSFGISKNHVVWILSSNNFTSYWIYILL